VTAIYDETAHEPLTDREWDPALVGHAIAAIVAEAESAVTDGVWPLHPRELDPGETEEDLRDATTLHFGSSGMIWALRALHSRLALAPLAEDALHRYRRRPDFGAAIPGLYLGEAGILLVLHLAGANGVVERLRELVLANERNPTWELFWGSPGTMVAACEVGLPAERERSGELLLAEWGEDGLWTQEIMGRRSQILGPAHGLAGNVHALRGLVDDGELRRRIEPPLSRLAMRDGDLVNWPPAVGDAKTRLQWCHGAPGIVATLGDLLPDDLLLGGAELTWHAGPLVKGPGLCHGTAGNGYALLRAYGVTGDETWLRRARRFAMHALEQVDRVRTEYGRGRFSLFTGDVGAALYARACVDGDPRFPTMDVW
jgi:Lanthionine synthetase C-like protein